MFKVVTPEKVGVSSKSVQRFLTHLNEMGLNTHDVILSRGYDIYCEAYWKPFNKDFLHRQYSQTKSFVGIAICLLLEEGKIKLTDKIADYFADKIEVELDELFKNQTIEDMLTMRTAVQAVSWFADSEKDRARSYFNKSTAVYPSGTIWRYDSQGSQVLCELVERVSGKLLLDYLRDKLFNKMGTFKNARILKTPSGASWGDSALLCTPRDMLSFAKLLINNGEWNGEQLMSAELVKKACSKIVSNAGNCHGSAYNGGYGYQIWRVKDDAFGFVGMGQQLTLCLPEKDLVFVINNDNQGSAYPSSVLFNQFYNDVVEEIQDKPLPEDKVAYESLQNYINSLNLRALKGDLNPQLVSAINGKKFKPMGETPQGITEFTLRFNGDEGEFNYVNAQGEKTIKFGVGKNVFGKFPQKGYSNEVGGIPSTDGYLYDCATSCSGDSENQFRIFVQIIDKYFGNISMMFGYKNGYMTVNMEKVAEYFLTEYHGRFVAKIEE